MAVVAALGGSFDALAAAAVQGNLEAGAEDYVEFGQLYLATLLLSATLTIAIAVYCVPTLDGPPPSYWAPVVILVVGASLTGLPVESAGAGPAGIAVGALTTFAVKYGGAFAAGAVVGVAGGGILYSAAKYAKGL